MSTVYWPFDQSTITEGFGWSDWRQAIHDGIDMGVAQGTPLRATMSGRVLRHYSDKWGAGIDIVSLDGVVARHWHLSRFDVENGQTVEAGQQIGLTGGAQGTWGAGFSTGPHLHWGTRVNGQWVDPISLNPKQFGDPSPIQTPKKGKEMFVVRNSSTGQTFTVGNQLIKHEQDATRAALVCTALMGGPSNALTFDQFGFDVFCDSMGIPRGTGASLVPGKTWSRQIDILKKK